jgi:hypothetical protein
MNANEFYSLFSATCFGMVGLWWNVVQARKDWLKDEGLKTIAGGVYLSFLIPGLMGLGAQIGGSDGLFWRFVFAVGAGFGMFYTFRLMTKTRNVPYPGPFRRNRWLALVLYGFILLGSLGFDLVFTWVGIQPIAVEAFWLCLIILLGHGLAWEFLTEVRPGAPTD